MFIKHKITRETGVQKHRFTGFAIFLVIIFLLLNSSRIRAQEAIRDFGKLGGSELFIKEYQQFPDAEAVVLFDRGEMGFGVRDNYKVYNLIRHKRIHILNESAVDLANYSMVYYSGDNMEMILDVDGYTHNLENGELQSYRLDRKEIQREKLDGEYTRITIPLPRVKPGSVIELTYRLSSFALRSPRIWYYQSDLPTVSSEFRFHRAQGYSYTYLIRGAYANRIEQLGGLCWRFSNLPALKEEPYITSVGDYRQQIQFQMVGYQGGTGTEIQMRSNWKQLSDELLKSQYLGRALRSRSDWESWVQGVNEKYESPEEKIRAMYNLVKANFDWTGERAYYLDERKLKDVFETRKGNSGEINLMMVQLMRDMGLDAHPILSATRNYGIVSSDYPILNQFNNLLCLVQLGEEIYLLDATDPLRSMDLLAYQDQNSPAFLIHNDKPAFINLPVNRETQTFCSATLIINEKGVVSGKVNQRLAGYDALSSRRVILSKGEEAQGLLGELMGDKWDAANYSGMELTGAKDPEADLGISFALESPEFTEKIGEFIYLSPLLFMVKDENPFLAEKRQLPIDFGYGFTETTLFNYSIPSGYEVESIPSNVKVSLPEGDAIFEFLCTQNGPMVQIKSSLQINRAYYPAEAYPALKELFDKLIARHSEKIVLKKKS